MKAQSIKLLREGDKISFRGLSVVDNKTVWVSGSNGTVGKSIDSGNSWKWYTIKNFEKTDFRDIEAFDDMTAIIMGIGEPANILKTIDGGENWKIVFTDSTKGMFLDAMEFWNEQSGVVLGDPINNKYFIARTFDGGRSWVNIPDKFKPIADSGEACFASSGTNIRKINNAEAIFVSGGMSAHLFIRDKKINIPIIQHTESSGANSIAVKNKNTFMIVGGDFNKKDSVNFNCSITFNGGKTWVTPQVPPNGYRSCVEFLKKDQWITCGLNGVDITNNNGRTFLPISKIGFHVCRKAKNGDAVFFAGGNGRIAKLIK